VRLIGAIKLGRSIAVSFAPPTYTSGLGAKGYVPDFHKVRATIRQVSIKPAYKVRVWPGVDALRLVCTG
jgi:hypothetical protein